MNRRDVLGFGMAIDIALALGLAPLAVQAQGKYPDRPIRLIIPFPPGPTDQMGRNLGANLFKLLGQPIVVENKTGAGGAIGATEAARAKPDGYTLLLATSSTHALNPLTMDNLAYDPVKDFTHIALLGISTSAVVVHPSVATSLQELIKRVKASPGKYSYGSSGVGGITHLGGELFKKQAGGLDIVHVPYRGGGPSIQDLVAGQIPISIAGLATALTFHRAGRVRILAAFSEKRSIVAPDIPTAIELGVPGMTAYTFSLLTAPAGTPKAIIDQIFQATFKVMRDENFQKQSAVFGMEPVTDSSPENATQFIKNELAKWAPVVKATGLKAE